MCYSRILLTSIKFLGQRPCPHCLVKKTDIYMMGMVLDVRRRVVQECTDSLQRWQRVEEAQKLIFELGALVDGSRVKAILNEESYVPICVSAATVSNKTVAMFALIWLFWLYHCGDFCYKNVDKSNIVALHPGYNSHTIMKVWNNFHKNIWAIYDRVCIAMVLLLIFLNRKILSVDVSCDIYYVKSLFTLILINIQGRSHMILVYTIVTLAEFTLNFILTFKVLW